ncbi:MAG: dihydroorotate dehydrogenase electron transfer subunit [Nitrospinae bacterium]|nr:dihydroorotate dehydrogenase electron transfer subunit [Nitrospinota bacterium]
MKPKILRNVPMGKRYRMIDFEWPDDNAQPGQFVMIRVTDSVDPLLRRPMSIAGLANGRMSIVCAVLGKGTAILSEKSEGDFLDVTGPYGVGFNPPESETALLCVMGGVGTAPFLFLKSRSNKKIIAFYGAADKDGLGIQTKFDEMHFSTVDGSVGTKGLVTDILLAHPEIKNKNAFLLACGPKGMLKAVDQICVREKIQGELSLEERMGCGFGVCLGCMVETDEGNKRVCVEGPVFKAGTVKW